MKKQSLLTMLLVSLVAFVFSSCCEPCEDLKKFKHQPGAVVNHKMHNTKIVVLDTIRGRCDEPLIYKVKGKDLNIYKISEHEIY